MLTANKGGPKRGTPALGVIGLLLLQEDKAWVSAISCQLLPILLWGHLFLLLAAEHLINPVHLPHLLQCVLTVSLHLLQEFAIHVGALGSSVCSRCFILGAQSGATRCPSLPALHTCSCSPPPSFSCVIPGLPSRLGSSDGLYHEDFTDIPCLDEMPLL